MSTNQFKADISAFKDKLRGRQDRVVRELASVLAVNMTVGGEVSPGTPRDTGFALASWWIGVNTMTGAPNTVNTPGGYSSPLSAMELAILGAKVGDTIYLLNNAEYIEMLESGHSGQAPAGFVRITAASAQRLVDDIAARMIDRV